MKKSTIIIALGLFIVVTALLGINNEKMYQKEKHFETTNEVLQQLDGKPLRGINEKGQFSETNDLKECFSERKRLTNSQFDYGKIEIEKVEELSENQKQSILKDYDKLRNEFTKRRVLTKEEPVRVNVNVCYSHMEQGKITYREPRKLKIELVLVDEGEGLVIDYINEIRSDESSEDGNVDA
ncbi:MAG TPA: hypothetical protein VF839_06825 [Clostridium sp.]